MTVLGAGGLDTGATLDGALGGLCGELGEFAPLPPESGYALDELGGAPPEPDPPPAI